MANTPIEVLKADLKAKTPGRFYVFCGTEAYLRSYYLEQLHKLTVQDFAEAFNYHRFNSENISLQAVQDSLEAIPMMSPSSLVQIDDVNFFAMGEDAASYAALFSDIPEYCTLVLVYETVEFKVDKRKRSLAAALDNACVVEFTQPSERELAAWVTRGFKRQKKSITPELCQYLIRRTGGSMTVLASEIGKLSSFAQDELITKDQIDELVEPVLEAEAFDLSNAIASGKYDTAVQKLQTLLQKQEEPVKILGAIGSQMRRILTAKRLLGGGKTESDLMSLCGISSYPAKKTMDFARGLSDRFCRRAAVLCLEADEQMKTSYDDPERILELLVLTLAQEARNG